MKDTYLITVNGLSFIVSCINTKETRCYADFSPLPTSSELEIISIKFAYFGYNILDLLQRNITMQDIEEAVVEEVENIERKARLRDDRI